MTGIALTTSGCSPSNSARARDGAPWRLALLLAWAATACGGNAAEPAQEEPWPNQPDGFTIVTDYGFDDSLPIGGGVPIGSSGWGIANPVSSNGSAMGASDGTAPMSPGHVAQFNYPIGYSGGGEPAVIYRSVGSGTELYVGFCWKASNPWQSHASGINKMLFQQFGAGGSLYLAWMDAERIRVATELTSEAFRNLEPNVTETRVTPGSWYKIEWYINRSTGSVKWWVNGVLNGNWTVGFPSESFGEFQFAGTWGGIGGTKSTNDWYRYDHVLISKR